MLDQSAMGLFDAADDLLTSGAHCVGPSSGFHDQHVYNGI